METTDLSALLLVAEHRSFQRAADAGRLNRSALRRRVARLEATLGVSLLLRGPDGVELTAAGRAVAERAAALLQEVDALAEGAREADGEARGVVRMVVPVGIPALIRARALVMLRSLHPELDMVVTESESPLSHTGEPFDLLFHFGPPPEREGWFSHVVTRLPLRLLAAPAYLEQRGPPGSVEALRAHPLMTWHMRGYPFQGLSLLSGGAAPARPWLRSANLELLVAMAQQQLGLAWLPGLPPSPVTPDTGLTPVLAQAVGGTLALRVLSPRSGRRDPRVRALLENLQRMLPAVSPGS
jgi:DNA-binding transcriptional LysR family regulator